MYPEALEKRLKDEWRQEIQKVGSGIYYITGEKFPVQILESKKLSEDNLFLKNLRSNLTAEDAVKVTRAYEVLKAVEKKNVYLDGIIKANMGAFKEAMAVSEAVRELFLDAAEEYGWFEKRENEKAIAIARKLLMRGIPAEAVAEDTNLPFEVVKRLV